MYSLITGGFAAFLYMLTGGLLGWRLIGSQVPSARITSVLLRPGPIVVVASAAVVLHALLLVHLLYQGNGINLSIFNALSLTGWLAAVLLLVLMPVKPIADLGIVLLPFSALTVLLVVVFPAPPLSGSPPPWPLQAHIVLSVLAYSLLTLAALQALLLALAERRLRQRRPGGFMRLLPPLTALEEILFQLIGVGFALLSLALLSGFLFLNDIFAQHLVHKTVLSLFAWLLFGILLYGRYRHGWRGRTAVRWTLGGFVLLALAYFGSQLVLQLILQRR